MILPLSAGESVEQKKRGFIFAIPDLLSPGYQTYALDCVGFLPLYLASFAYKNLISSLSTGRERHLITPVSCLDKLLCLGLNPQGGAAGKGRENDTVQFSFFIFNTRQGRFLKGAGFLI